METLYIARTVSVRSCTPWSIKRCHFYFLHSCMKHCPIFFQFLACDIRKKLDANDCSFGQLNLILSVHYIVKCRSRSLAVYNNEFTNVIDVVVVD